MSRRSLKDYCEQFGINKDEVTAILTTMGCWADGAKVPSFENIIKQFGISFDRKRYWDNLKNMNYEIALSMVRHEAIKRFGFVLPSAELLDQLKQHGPILEIGAGSGYMTALMRHRGIDVVGTDSCFGDGYGFKHGAFDLKQMEMTGSEAVLKYPNRNIFCSWPTLNSTWFCEALQVMRKDQLVIIVEEDACADNDTWHYRDEHFHLETKIDIPNWPCMHDRAGTWVKCRA